MKLSVKQENLSQALSSVARIASSSGTLPILSNVLIKTVNNQLSIAATNLDIAISKLIGGKIEREGSITVPARLMQDFISSLPNGVINLDLKDHKLHIHTDKYQSTINGIDPEEFPVMPTINNGKNWKVPASQLKSVLAQVIIASGSDESRPVLTGVLLEKKNNFLYLAATDSYRLAEKKMKAPEQEIKLLVPASSLKELLRILDNTEGDEVDITYDDQQVLFEVNSISLVTRLIDGNYPDYKKLIPSTFQTTVSIEKKELINITKVSSLFARESAGSITIRADDKSQQISIKSIASQLGENTSSADAKIKGSGEITLNSRYLLEALNVVNGENVVLKFNGKLEPIVLTDEEDGDYLHIIMPLKS